ncbi:MAG: exodeoxyribonuclease VII small subunit [Clostridia bacterium]|nr:exodeoxyribonuclease VII small subunit [Clostridia bacterium]
MSESFENNLKKLESIVTKLESGECGLDESLELYSEGIKLSADCKKQLETARQKIEQISDYAND